MMAGGFAVGLFVALAWMLVSYNLNPARALGRPAAA